MGGFPHSVDLHSKLTHLLCGKVIHLYNLKSLNISPFLGVEVGYIILQYMAIIGLNFSAS